jgi:hypothetical protein
MRFLSRLTTSDLDGENLDNRDITRGLIDQGELVVEQEQYHDDPDGAQRGIVGPDNTDNNRPRVEPSGLAADNDNVQWRDNA